MEVNPLDSLPEQFRSSIELVHRKPIGEGSYGTVFLVNFIPSFSNIPTDLRVQDFRNAPCAMKLSSKETDTFKISL